MSSRVSFDNNISTKNYNENSKEFRNYSPEMTPKQVATPINIPSSTSSGGPIGVGSGVIVGGERRRRTRRRRDSEASSSLSSLSETLSSESPSPTTPPPVVNDNSPNERMSPEIATSPILSYFMAHASPVKSASDRQFLFNRDNSKSKMATSPSAGSALDDVDGLPHVLHHARRMSQNWDQQKSLGISQKLPPSESQQGRNTSLMRRLSLSGSTQRPSGLSLSRSMESKSLLAPTVEKPPVPTTPRRSATISQAGPIRRPPSPMGERMLKGDFHGF